MSTGIRSYDQYLFAIAVLVGTYIALIFLLWLTQRSRYARFLHTFEGVAPNFLTVVNVIFALNLAFLANDTWRAHDRALDAVIREGGGLRSIISLAERLPGDVSADVNDAVSAYVHLVVSEEWPLLARRQSSQAASDQLFGLLTLLSSDRIASVANPATHGLVLEQAEAVSSMRDERIALSQTHVNPLKWMGMGFLGFLTMVSVAMVHITRPRAQLLSVLLFATAAAPTAAMILVHGNPFQEPMAIGPAPIAEILDLIPPAPADPAD